MLHEQQGVPGPGEFFISDVGNEKTVEIDGTDTIMGRYAVWRNAPDRPQLQLIEVGRDLKALMKKYHVEQAYVGRVTG